MSFNFDTSSYESNPCKLSDLITMRDMLTSADTSSWGKIVTFIKIIFYGVLELIIYLRWKREQEIAKQKYEQSQGAAAQQAIDAATHGILK